MRILWVVNILFPYPSKKMGKKINPFGGWLIGLFNEIKDNKNIKLAIATVCECNSFQCFNNENITYYLIPKNDQKNGWYDAINEFNPDLIHLHGTELGYGKLIQNLFPERKVITSIQGLVSIYSDFYIANIKHRDILKSITLRDLLKGNIYKEQRDFFDRGKLEQEILKKSTAVIGRTNWDCSCSYSITGEDKYYKCNESLRDSFYKEQWNIENIEKNSIFISQASYPIKGFHIVLEAANILKYKYNYDDLKIYVAGNNIIDTSTLIKKIKLSGYSKYILSLIKRYKLEKNIVFTGLLKENEMIERLKKSNVFVQASSIENSPNSLGEAMLIGMPCVASNVGGTSDMLKDKEEGYLYPFGDYSLLAYYISKIFDNSIDVVKMGTNARKHALITHDRKNNAETMLEIYKKVINNEK